MPVAPQRSEEVVPRLHTSVAQCVIVAVIVGALLVLLVPLAPLALDLLLALNFLAALMCLLLTISVQRPIEFTALPVLLLLSSLLRIILSIAATRLIISTGTGGAMIETFGRLASAGQLAVGVAFLLILVVALFVVVTSGAGRVAEVAARFALDAMPGKQMSVDADLSAGNIDADEAQQKRREIQAEADFYGAMDGASKFVRGDAIGAVVVIAVAFAGGVYVGITRDVLSAQAAGAHYAMLAVGEGIVILLPALLMAVAAAIMVSRGVAASDLAGELGAQVLLQPAAAAAAGVALLLLALIPGTPKLPLALVGVATLVGAWFLHHRTQPAGGEQFTATSAHQSATRSALAQPLQLEVGHGLLSLLVDHPEDGLLAEIAQARETLTTEYGAPVPSTMISDSAELGLSEFRLLVRGVEVLRASVMPARLLAMPPFPSDHPLQVGVPADERLNITGAVWLRPETAETLQASPTQAVRYRLQTPARVIAWTLRREIEARLGQLLGLEETAELLAEVRRTHPAVLEQLDATGISRATIRSVLQQLLNERIPINDLIGILEALAQDESKGKSAAELAETARKALSATITSQACRGGRNVSAVTLHPALAELLAPSNGPEAPTTVTGSASGVDPRLAEWLVGQFETLCATADTEPVVLCPSDVRSIVSRILHQGNSDVLVVSAEELLPDTTVDVIGEIPPPDWHAEPA